MPSVYDKIDNKSQNTSRLNILHVIFVTAEQTGDYQTTFGIRRILEHNGNMDDIIAFFEERMLHAWKLARPGRHTIRHRL